MNRLIIVGNGFDRFHGLESDYKSFIQNYLYNSIINFIENRHYDDLLISIECKSVSFPQRIYIPDVDKENIFKTIGELKKKNNKYDIEFKFKSEFFVEICIDAERKWVDIERTYYKYLIKEYKELTPNDTDIQNLDAVIKLNNQMDFIKTKLIDYLKEIDKKKNYSSGRYISESPVFREIGKHDVFPTLWKEIEDISKTPERVMILNFNYTCPFNTGYNKNIDIINIHGRLSNSKSIVFGYGDERDEKYLELEKLGEDEVLKNIKSFAYFHDTLYGKLLGFIEQNDYEVWIAGHSCGLSDKTLLAQIFEHKHCKSIKVFYYKKDEKDNYNEIVYNIARVMSDKIKMRGIVTPKSPNNEFSVVGQIIF